MADVVTLIEQDHRKVEQVFSKLQSGDGDRRTLVEQLTGLLVPHTEAEEEVVYPEIERAGVESFHPDEANEEHAEAAELLEELAGAIDDDATFLTTLQELQEAVGHHVEEEEQQILPEFRGKAQTDLDQLGQRFEQAKQARMASR